MRSHIAALRSWPQLLLTIWSILNFNRVLGAYVEFTNCLSESLQKSEPRILQFVPLNVSASFGPNDSHVLNITFYGNVTGQLFNGTYPSPDDPLWTNPNDTFGKIVDVEDGADKATTLFGSLNVLTYTPYNAPPARFCENVVGEDCPIGPVFYRNGTDVSDLPGYVLNYDLGSSYAFTTIDARTRIQAGTDDARYYGCVTAYITPNLGASLKALLTYLPMVILIIVGVATISAAVLSPWGSSNVFNWSSNYGRDEDILRLVTPGFGDCLQYLQFVMFTGSLSLNYPGYYQPVVSRIGWSTLLFNESLVTGGNGTDPVVDGIYQYRPDSKHGLDRITQLIGMTSPSDAWAAMMVWFVVILVCVVVLTQIGFLLQWIYRQVQKEARQDLRSKNWYFSVGNVVRIALGYFLLPLVTMSMFQFVISNLGPVYAVALAAVVLAFIVAFTAWLIFLFARTRPRSFLFDDLQTVLLYGPLYNTYRDNTATYALIPIIVNFMRGIAIGAVQDSGVAQIILLAICEIVLILTTVAIRPYPAATSMNLYQTCFAVVRLLTIMLAIAFVPALNASGASRGWLGYVILFIHACVLVFGFFLNAIQTLVEIIARLAGAGATGGHDAARGGLVKVFGMRQLSRRLPRKDVQRSSMGSNAQMLNAHDKAEMTMTRTRTRTMSASSNLLLDSSKTKQASQIDDLSQGRNTPDGTSTISRLSKNLASPAAIVGLAKTESRDAYYRPPRRNTNDFSSSAANSSQNQDAEGQLAAVSGEGMEASSQHRVDHDDVDDSGAELTKTKTDYAVREVDFYYGMRGGPLGGSGGTRRMKTGPADPTGPVSSARGWFMGLLGNKTKDKGKGFEVVRSARAPPPGLIPATIKTDEQAPVPYKDDPLSPPQKHENDGAASVSEAEDPYMSPIPRAPTRPPLLPAISTISGIELPSRIGSEASRKRPIPEDSEMPPVPPVPRKSSRRESSPASKPEDIRAPPATAAPSESPSRTSRDVQHLTSPSQRLPFARTSPNRQSQRHSAAVSDVSSYMDEPLNDDEATHRQSMENRLSRPESVGFVNHHRASESIRYSPDETQLPRLSTVEYGYQPPHQASQPQPQPQQQTPTTPWTPAWNGSSAYGTEGSQRFSRFRD